MTRGGLEFRGEAQALPAENPNSIPVLSILKGPWVDAEESPYLSPWKMLLVGEGSVEPGKQMV